jgi:hypothetical protein
MTKTKSKFKENPFHITTKDNLIEVWLGEPNDDESDYILTIDKFWLPELIAKLKEVRL